MASGHGQGRGARTTGRRKRRRKLNRLVSDRELCRRKTGQTVVYWRADGRGDGTVDSASTGTPN
ncbi:hypothetical protein [Natrinema hispanicum]|uniref:hypothetical protein n=1 Tax=Natrinema hispanicum TaxID=392421 RepID=UPI00102B3628|nr:hypothetical protein [Natrinema hispanicum]